jgi:hypothetical protein
MRGFSIGGMCIMTERRSLVLVDGVLKQLPDGDTLGGVDLTSLVRFDADQTLTPEQIARVQRNLDVAPHDFKLIYQTAKL